MSEKRPHISVCICTYKRPDLLKRLLADLARQETAGRFTFSILVVDNDNLRSAESVVQDCVSGSLVPITYCVENRQNIALARNRAVEQASGDFIAFIDDDEFPTKRWLLTLFNTLDEHDVDGVLGPVKPHFDKQPPGWVVKGGFYDRPSYPTGLVIDGRKGRTGNVLLSKHVFAAAGTEPFRPEFRTGEDQDFFRRMIEKGYVFIWCHEALAYETVLPVRWKRTFMLRRALLRGANSVEHPTFGASDIAKSLLAVPAYSVTLPFALVLGQARFMAYLVSLFDHLGRLLAVLGINPIKEQYVTE
jgi:glycosyltransferase involved in cell wall biosynthesis